MKKRNLSKKYYSFSNSIQFKYLVYMLLAACFIFIVLLSYNFVLFRSVVRENVALRANETSRHIVSSTNSFLSQIIKVAKGVELSLRKDNLTEREIERLLKDVVLDNKEVYACRIGFEPYTLYPEQFSLLTQRAEELHPSLQVNVVHDDFTNTDDYIRTVSQDESFFILPRREEALESVSVFAYITPISHANRDGSYSVKGAICVYVSVKWFNVWLKNRVDQEDGYVAVIGPETDLIAQNRSLLVEGNSLLSIAKNIPSPQLEILAKRIMNKESGSAEIPLMTYGDNANAHVSFEQLLENEWSVFVALRDDALFKDASKVYLNLVEIGIAGLVLLALVFFFIIRRISRPLSRLADSTKLVALGNFDVELPQYDKKDEVGRLTYSMQMMINRLKIFFYENLEKERMEGELRVAKEIQDTIIPHNYPAFPQITSIDAYGRVEAAKLIGGDFFDYILCKERYLYFMIGDVSGNGVPASLLMAVTRTLFRSNACIQHTGEISMRINQELCVGNKANMFVTSFIGILDSHTGKLTYTNAGHNYPFVRKVDGDIEELKQKHGIPLGMLDSVVYRMDELQLSSGDILMLYTDGVNETRKDDYDLFGVSGVEEYLKSLSAKENVFDITNGLFEKVKSYASGEDTFVDDVTVLTIKYVDSGEFEYGDKQ